MEIPDHKMLIMNMQEQKQGGNIQNFRLEQFLPKRATRSQTEGYKPVKKPENQSLSKDQKTRGKKKINYKELVNQPQQFDNLDSQKSSRSKQEHKSEKKQQKKNHENFKSIEEYEATDYLKIDKNSKSSKIKGRPQSNSSQSQYGDTVEKGQKKGKQNANQNQYNNGSFNYDAINILNGNKKLTSNQEGVNQKDYENNDNQVIVQQSSSEQSKNKTEPFRSDAPDYLLAIIDNTIENDQQSILRKNLVAHKIDEIVEPCSLITTKIKKLPKIQIYLPFQQEKFYQYQQIELEPMISKKQKKKKGSACKNKRKNNKKNTSNKKQKQQAIQLQLSSQNDLNEQSSALNQQQDEETSATFTGSQNGEKNLLEKQNDQLMNFKSPIKDSIDEEEAKDIEENQQNNISYQLINSCYPNNAKDLLNHNINQNTNNINSGNIFNTYTNNTYQNEKNNLDSSNQSLTSNSKFISPKQSQNSNNDDDMDIEEDDYVAEHNQEEIDDNNSDEDIFEDYINQFTSEEEVRLIKCSNLSPYFKNLFLDDLNYQLDVKHFNQSKILNSETIPQPQLNCLTQTKITSIDALRERAENNTYYEFSEFDRDMRKLFNYTLKFRCKSIQSFQYITFLIRNYYEYVKKNNSINQFENIKKKDLHALLKGDQDNKMQVKKWPIIPTSYRNYQQITEYDPQPPSFENDIKEKLKSKKQPVKCDQTCGCNSFSTMGDFNLEDTTWRSTCENRAKRMECIECECQNQQVSKGERKVIGKDVEETLCWGIDLYTKKNIFYILPERHSDKQKNQFIQFQLIKAINLQKDKGWDIIHCCNFILQKSQSKQQRLEQINEETQPKFNEDSRKCAKSIIKAIQYIKKAFIDQNIDPEGLYSEGFRIHTKGMGLICISPKGIQQNEFITEYVGEIYQPWRWYEKQDIIKKYMKEQNKRDILPDFWNIMLEIHKDDEKGYDILFVDPILKGNFSSRLSHSCEPNCGTVPTVTNARNYVIAMYAMHPIDYGEELSFDYMAVTESTQEHKVREQIQTQQRAVCLCGSSKCRGRYLELSNSNIKQFNSILEKIHCFLNRTHTLYKACTEQLNEEDEAILEQSSFKSNIRDNSPKWLQKWSALVLSTINQEYDLFLEELIENEKKKIYKDDLSGLTPDQINLKNELPLLKYLAQSRKDARIQNLVISIDKVKYYINQINDQNPPLLEMQNDQLLENYWSKTENTLKEDLLEVLQQIHSKATNYQFVDYANIIISNATKQIQMYQKFGQFTHGLLVVRVVVLIISDLIQQMKNCNIQSDALSLILHFHAFTHKFFKTHNYKKYSSEEQKIQKEDIINVELFDEDQQGKMQEFTPFSEKKTYSSLFVWGQLNMWYKQSVINPASSLPLERRGPLIYPQLSNSFKENLNQFPFVDNKTTDNPKQAFTDHLKAKPECYWTGDQFNKWSFRNQMNQFGSFMYESMYYQKEFPNYIEQVIDSHTKPFKEKIDFLKEVEIKLSGLSQQEIEDIINSVINDSPDSYYEAFHGFKRSLKINISQILNTQKSDDILSASDALNYFTQKKRKTENIIPTENNFEVSQSEDKSKISINLQGVSENVTLCKSSNLLNNNIIKLISPQMAQQQQSQQQISQNILLNQYQQQLNEFLDSSTLKNLQNSQLEQINSLYQKQQSVQSQQNPNQNDFSKFSPPLNPFFNSPQLTSLQNSMPSQYQQQNPQFLNTYQNQLNQVAQSLIAQNPILSQQNSSQNQQLLQQQQQNLQKQTPQLQQQQSQNMQQPYLQNNQVQTNQQQLQQIQHQNSQQILGQNLQSQQQLQQNQLLHHQIQNPLIQNQLQSQATNPQNQTLSYQQQQLVQTNPQLLTPSMQNQQQQQQPQYGAYVINGQQQQQSNQNKQAQQIQNNFNNQSNNSQFPNQQQTYNSQLAHYQLQMQQNPQFFQNALQNQQISQQQQQQLSLQQQNSQQPQNQTQSRSQPYINNSIQLQQNQQSKSQPNIQIQNNFSNTYLQKIQDPQIQTQEQSQIQQQSGGLSTGGSNGEIHSQKSIPIPISPHIVGAVASPLPYSQINANHKSENPSLSNPGQLLLQKQESKFNQQEQQIMTNSNQISSYIFQSQNKQLCSSSQNRGKGLVINTGNNFKDMNLLLLNNMNNDANIQNSKEYPNQHPGQQMLQQQQSQILQNTPPLPSINNNSNFGFTFFDDPTNIIKLQNEQNLQNNDDLRNRKSSAMSGNSIFSQKNSSHNQNSYLHQQLQNSQMDVINQVIGNFSPYGLNQNANINFSQLNIVQNNNFIGQSGYTSNTYNILDDKGQLKSTPPLTPQQPQQLNQSLIYNNNAPQNNIFIQNPSDISINRSYSHQNTQQQYNLMLNQEYERNIPNFKQYQEIQQATNYQKQEIASPSAFLDQNIFSSVKNLNNQEQQSLFSQSMQQSQQNYQTQRPLQQQQQPNASIFNYQQHMSDANQQQ